MPAPGMDRQRRVYTQSLECAAKVTLVAERPASAIGEFLPVVWRGRMSVVRRIRANDRDWNYCEHFSWPKLNNLVAVVSSDLPVGQNWVLRTYQSSYP